MERKLKLARGTVVDYGFETRGAKVQGAKLCELGLGLDGAGIEQLLEAVCKSQEPGHGPRAECGRVVAWAWALLAG
jgi:hypothetical protein